MKPAGVKGLNDVADAADGDGVLVTVRRSRTNQEGETTDVRFVKGGVARAIRTLRAAANPGPTDRVAPLSPKMWGCGSRRRPRAAGVERVTAHSGRVGLASEPTSRGASTTDVMLAGNWKTSRMVAHYSAGAVGGRAVPGVLRGADREREDAGGVRAGRRAIPRVVRGARSPAARRLPAPRGRLHPDAPRVGPDREAAPGRDPLVRRLARRQPGHPGEPRRGRAGAEARRHQRARRRSSRRQRRGSSSRRSTRAPWPGSGTGRLLSVMLYSFARVSAVLGMRRQDYFGQGSRGWLRLHEKGGKRHDVPAHHRAAAALDAYVEAGRLEEPKVALFQTVDPAARRLTGRALDRRLVLAMIKRRAAAAGLPPSTCCHTFRATGITAYLSNGGTLEHAQQIAGHASPKTTKLYDRTVGHGDGGRDRANRDLNNGFDRWGDAGLGAPPWLTQRVVPAMIPRAR